MQSAEHQLRTFRALAAAVLLAAFESIDAACRPKCPPCQAHEGRRAWRWMEDGTAGGVFTYLSCCELVEFDPEAGRAFARRMIHGEVTLAEACERARLTPDPQPQPPREGALLLTPEELARADEILGRRAPADHPWRK